MLMIRLQRVGRKHEPVFRVVLTDSKNSTKSGRFLEVLGSYDPRREEPTLSSERILFWVSKGAKLSDTMHNLLISKGVIKGKKINVLPRKSLPSVALAEEGVPSEATAKEESSAISSGAAAVESGEGAVTEAAPASEPVSA